MHPYTLNELEKEEKEKKAEEREEKAVVAAAAAPPPGMGGGGGGRIGDAAAAVMMRWLEDTHEGWLDAVHALERRQRALFAPLRRLVKHPWFDHLVIVCVALNSLLIAANHYGRDTTILGGDILLFNALSPSPPRVSLIRCVCKFNNSKKTQEESKGFLPYV